MELLSWRGERGFGRWHIAVEALGKPACGITPGPVQDRKVAMVKDWATVCQRCKEIFLRGTHGGQP